MKMDSFSQQIDSFSQRVLVLFERLSPWLHSHESNGSTTNGHESLSAPFCPEITAMAFKELGFAVEELQVAFEEIQQQNKALAAFAEMSSLERRRYENLFRFAPQAYLITDLQGKIEEANLMASHLLDVPLQYLIGKPLVLYLTPEARLEFWRELEQRKVQDCFQEWELTLESRNAHRPVVACSVMALRNSQGTPCRFQWAMRDITERKRIELLLRQGDALGNEGDVALLQNRPIRTFNRRDTISYEPQSLWYVVEGLVKLTTLTDQNKEVLLGLLGPGSPFGSFLTTLPLQEAMALSEVKLLSISLSEIFASPQLAQLLFVKTAHRLRRTEVLLAISGEPSAEKRLMQLLRFLREEVGQPVDNGIRLCIRLTHEDLASACCTTRVTVTRLFGKLQQDGFLWVDDTNHLVVRERS